LIYVKRLAILWLKGAHQTAAMMTRFSEEGAQQTV
jgi:hypothetical protein